MSFLEQYDLTFDAGLLEDTLLCSPFVDENEQVMITSRNQPAGSGTEYILDGTGSLLDVDDFEWKHLLPLWKDTYVEEVYNKVSERFKVGRARIMKMGKGKCYTLHTDKTKRLHVPIVTNRNCLFFDSDYNKYSMPEPGQTYILDTTQPHTAANFSYEDRIHMVFVIDD